MGNGIRHWPTAERPREKMQRAGAAALSDAELLALLLRTGDAASGQSAVDLGRQLLQSFGDLRRLAAASQEELCRVPGTGPAKAASIQAALALGERLAATRLEHGERLVCAEQVFNHYHASFRDRRREHFLALLLDARNRVVADEAVSVGTLTQSLVHPREVFRSAVRLAAAAVILVHNHPSGDPAPSDEDRAITRRLRETGELLGIRVLDHVILGDGRYFSFADHGLL